MNAECEPVLFQGGVWDGLEIYIDDLKADVEIIELRGNLNCELAFYRRQGDSRTYKFIGEDHHA